MSKLQFIADHHNGMSESTFAASVAATGTLTNDDIVLLATTGIREYAATAASVIISNTASRSSSEDVWIHLRKLSLACSAVNSSGTSTHYVTFLDNADRYSSGGTTLTSASTSVDTRSGYTSRTPKAAVYVGALVAASATSTIQCERGQVTDAVHVVGDKICFNFDGSQDSITTGTDADGSVHNIGHSDVWIGPGCSFLLHLIMPAATTGGTWHPNLQYVETNHPRFNA